MSASITPGEADALDPSLPAPPVLVDVADEHGSLGHGRTIPLIGNQRQYLLDVLYADGTKRVYADDAADAVAAIVGGEYPQLVERMRELLASDDADAVDDELRAVTMRMLRLRYEHADVTRALVQAQVVERAKASGAWDFLPLEEQQILSTASEPEGAPPVGVIAFGFKAGDPAGAPMREYGIWDADVPLVLNTGDYEPFTNVPEPECALRYGSGPYGDAIMPGDENLIRLVVWAGPSSLEDDDAAYLRSLDEAGAVRVVMRQNDLPDEMFAEAILAMGDQDSSSP